MGQPEIITTILATLCLGKLFSLQGIRNKIKKLFKINGKIFLCKIR